jgi:cytochrome c oxidase assembly protein subunit 15
LHRYAVFVAICTGFLVFAGGLVKSTESGLAVPDWPLSFGQLMPPMEGGVFYEHGHRMVATGVGILTIILTVWLFRSERRRWVRRLGPAALVAVIVQGLLGGLTVLLKLPAPVSMAHALVGQTFFCIVVAIALFTSRGWQALGEAQEERGGEPTVRTLALWTTASVYVQLLLGAWMRHTEAALAIPDFPLAFGGLIPPFDRPGVPIHFAHRVWALVVTCLAVVLVGRTMQRHRTQSALVNPALWLATLVIAQVCLGGVIIWTRRAVHPTTLHVLNGAVVLATSLVLTLRAYRLTAPTPAVAALTPAPAARAAT